MKKLTISLSALGALVIVLFLTTSIFNLTEFVCLLSFLTVFHTGAEWFSEGKKRRGSALVMVSVSSLLFILTGIPF
ncbi:hypothetical protein H0266_15035 [Halobacillus locisalis]|uniref:Uncharacterized protein n=1 Tax=Halobacillus locisalis TaxID=220753 RepID=A0A838CW69_9BACI|nr:hypothetical protein [Halobacillus locisalis]MBA2176210.1 hypothetical protein [Halobacillus locisalis]